MSQERLRAYLQRHRIGSLFEDMMTMLITETPEEPIPCLIEHLEGRQHKRTFTEESPRRDLAGFAALWAENSRLPESSPKGNPFRTYVTLCVDHTKKPRKSKSELAVSCLSPASSEARPMSQSLEPSSWDCSAANEGDMAFTELRRLLRECQWLDKTLREHTSGIIADDTVGKVSDYGERRRSPEGTTAEPGPRVARGRPPRRGGRVQDGVGADLLAAEVLLLPTRKQGGLGGEPDAQAPNIGQRRVNAATGAWAQREQHKLRLAAMLAVPRGHRTWDGAPHDDEDDEVEDEVTEHLDDAVELLEDEEDLRREGVFSPRRSVFRISRGRMLRSAEPQAKVGLNICSRCARLQGVDDQKEDAETSFPGPASFIEKSVSLELAEGTLKDTETQHPTSSTQLCPARPVPVSKSHLTGQANFVRFARGGGGEEIPTGIAARPKPRAAAATQQRQQQQQQRRRRQTARVEQTAGQVGPLPTLARSASEPSRFIAHPCREPLAEDAPGKFQRKAAGEDAHRTAAKVAAVDCAQIHKDLHRKPPRPRLPSILDKNHVLIVSTSWQQMRGTTVPFYFGASFEKWL
ncbi:uncharacterized protein C8orf34 homolog isoform X1 [Petromyzon marinus]|uniref:Uncharacterized protein C8orf34-like isoform X1 n=1 Tax=Petromyzon marinus TaxID=7757 RepID=A0AAJ7T3I7_PETMA|nr:uncharacterized protein C8orf34-like isoform X1 [Petromyzon marinus]